MNGVGYAPLADQLAHRGLVDKLCNLGLLPAPTGVREEQFVEAVARALDELDDARGTLQFHAAAAEGKRR